MDRPSGVSSASDASWAASATSSSVCPAAGKKPDAIRLPRVIVPVLSSSSVCTSPAASTARPLMASTFRCTRRSMPAMPMAERSAPMVVGMRQTSRDTRMTTETVAPGVLAEGLQRDHDGDEDDGQHGQQDRQGDLVRGLLPVRPLDQGDHPVEEGLAALGRDAHDDPVREDRGAAGDGRAVAAGLADDRRRLAGDGRLVDRGDALDDLAVGGDEVAGLADDDVALGQLGGCTSSSVPSGEPARLGLRAHLAQRVGLRLATAFGHGLGEVGEDHREEEPDRDGPANIEGWAIDSMKVTTVPDEHDEHDGVLDLHPGVELLEGVDEGLAQDLAVEQAPRPRRRRAAGRPARAVRSVWSRRGHQKNFPWLSCSTIGPEARRRGRTSGRR